MPEHDRPVLASTFHEPEFRLGEAIEACSDLLVRTFSSVVVSVTPKTHPDLVTLIRSRGLRVVAGEMARTPTYRRALEAGLAVAPAVVFSCDFDRVLHWASVYPEELAETARAVMAFDFTLVARTERAFATHPSTQRETESIGNLVCSRLLGFDGVRDVISATWAARPPVLERILEDGADDDYGLYTEWPMIGYREASEPGVIEVEGLEWETPDRFGREIAEIGYERWLAEFESPGEWRLRTALARRAIEVALDGAARLRRDPR